MGLWLLQESQRLGPESSLAALLTGAARVPPLRFVIDPGCALLRSTQPLRPFSPSGGRVDAAAWAAAEARIRT